MSTKGERLTGLGDLIAALTWPIDVVQELKEMEDEPDAVTDYASLLRAQREYKVISVYTIASTRWAANHPRQAIMLHTAGPLRFLLALMLPSLAKPRK